MHKYVLLLLLLLILSLFLLYTKLKCKMYKSNNDLLAIKAINFAAKLNAYHFDQNGYIYC